MLGDAKVAAEQGLRRGGPETNDYFRVKRGEFGLQPGPASSYFRSIGFFVDATFSTRFPFKMLHGIGDVNCFAINTCFCESLVQEMAGGPTKGLPSRSS
jgi:hypothetical protein